MAAGCRRRRAPAQLARGLYRNTSETRAGRLRVLAHIVIGMVGLAGLPIALRPKRLAVDPALIEEMPPYLAHRGRFATHPYPPVAVGQFDVVERGGEGAPGRFALAPVNPPSLQVGGRLQLLLLVGALNLDENRRSRAGRQRVEEFYNFYDGELTMGPLNRALREWEAFYNEERRRQSLGWRTPMEYLAERRLEEAS